MEYARLGRESSSVLSASKESSAQAASAARIRRDAPPWLGLLTTRGLDEDTAKRQRMREIRHGLPFLDADAGVPRRREPAELRDPALGALDDWLSERAERVAATPAELAVAESRAQAVTEALAAIYPGADVYQTGSIAHGDALSPLNDVDLGVILTNRPDLGPDPGQSGPQEEMRRTAARLADLLRPQFPNVTADPNNKRSIVLEFNDPATPGADDFTCDVIIALEQPGRPRISRTKPDKAKPDRTLLIPNTGVSGGWDETTRAGTSSCSGRLTRRQAGLSHGPCAWSSTGGAGRARNRFTRGTSRHWRWRPGPTQRSRSRGCTGSSCTLFTPSPRDPLKILAAPIFRRRPWRLIALRSRVS